MAITIVCGYAVCSTVASIVVTITLYSETELYPADSIATSVCCCRRKRRTWAPCNGDIDIINVVVRVEEIIIHHLNEEPHCALHQCTQLAIAILIDYDTSIEWFMTNYNCVNKLHENHYYTADYNYLAMI